MNREHLLAARHLAMEECAFQNAFTNLPSVHVYLGKQDEPKVEFVAATNTYSEWELNWLGIDTERQKSGLVAIIPVQGALAPFWSYGGTNTEWLSRQIEICLGNDAISAIVLKGMSGGGTVAGTLSVAETVRKAQDLKPILGYVNGMAASAAYWIFSQTREIYLESAVSTALGSIGVLGVFVSEAKRLEQEGYDIRLLRSKGSEDKSLLHPAEPINEDALKEEQRIIDAMRVEFLSHVQANRPKITQDPGGKLYYGKDAIRIGMADGVGSLYDTIKRADYLARKQMSLVA